MSIEVEATGVVFSGYCNVDTELCTTKEFSGALTAVWSPPGRIQVNVCGSCLNEMIRQGMWKVKEQK